MCQSTDGLHNKDGSDRIMAKFDISLTERVESGRKMCFERMSACILARIKTYIL